MKNITKTTQTILFASLIAALILPFSAMSMADAAPNEKANEQKNKKELLAYEKILFKKNTELKNMSDNEKSEYIDKLRIFTGSLTGYEAKVFDKIEQYAEATEKLETAKTEGKSDKTIKKLERKTSKLFFQLEDLGVTTKDRLNANPEYWVEKVKKAKNNSAGTKNVSGYDTDSNLHYVDQTDLALKRDATVAVPCYPGDLSALYCISIASGWNEGSSTATWGFLLFSGPVDYYSAVCLDQSTHHSSVDFDMDTVRKVITIFGTEATSSNTYDLNFSSQGDCSDNELTQWVDASNKVETVTSISNISLN